MSAHWLQNQKTVEQLLKTSATKTGNTNIRDASKNKMCYLAMLGKTCVSCLPYEVWLCCRSGVVPKKALASVLRIGAAILTIGSTNQYAEAKEAGSEPQQYNPPAGVR